MDDDIIPLSQLANEAFNPVAAAHLNGGSNLGPGAAAGPTDFRDLCDSLRPSGSCEAAGPGPGSAAAAARASKSGKLFQVGFQDGWGGLQADMCAHRPCAGRQGGHRLLVPPGAATHFPPCSCSRTPCAQQRLPLPPCRTPSTAPFGSTRCAPPSLTRASSSACAASSSWASRTKCSPG